MYHLEFERSFICGFLQYTLYAPQRVQLGATSFNVLMIMREKNYMYVIELNKTLYPVIETR